MYLPENYRINWFFYLFWCSSIISVVVVGFTSNNAGIKAPWGGYPGYVISFVIYFMVLKIAIGKHWFVHHCICAAIPLCLVLMFYNNTFLYGDISECNYRVESGIFKGLKVKKDDGIRYEKIENVLNEQLGESISDGHETIMFTNYDLVCEYLSSDRIPLATTANWWPMTTNPDGTMNWEFTEYYWDYIGTPPDDIVNTAGMELTGSVAELLRTDYKQIYTDEYIEIYHHNGR